MRLRKTQLFEKKAPFLVTKVHWPTFSSIIEYENPQRTTNEGSQVIQTINVQVMR